LRRRPYLIEGIEEEKITLIMHKSHHQTSRPSNIEGALQKKIIKKSSKRQRLLQ